MKNCLLYLLLLFFSTFCIEQSVFANTGPTDQLKPTLEKMVEIITDPQYQGEDNKEKLRQRIMSAVKERFDFGEMSKRVLGKTWQTIDSEQQTYFTALMTQLLENSYIGQLENYSGQTIEYVGERIKKNRAQVSTLIENEGTKFPVHYIMTKNNKGWMVYDINIEGVSLIRNYRAEFKSIIRREKFDGLVKVLEEKNRSFQ